MDAVHESHSGGAAAARGSTVLELLRHETSARAVRGAGAREAIEVPGETIPTGAVVMMMIGAANRDPEVLPNPARIDVDRPNLNRQLAFGGGIHACVGSALARAQGEIGVTMILEQYPTLELDDEVGFGHTEFLRVIRHMPVRLG